VGAMWARSHGDCRLTDEHQAGVPQQLPGKLLEGNQAAGRGDLRHRK